ncbi:MAG: phenylalanine--tRNA ligase subunit beta [Muribaculaceae bacterium]|nr:phenylalanine--tRNA ligase subunit beta [Muribaculaceae bacterium]
MDISYKWLKRYIDFNESPKELAAVFTSTGLECDQIEEVESIRGGLRGLKIGKILTCVPHPDSDHMHVTTVDIGGDAPLQIVCGAPNVAAGQTVVVATIGTVLYDGDKEFTIKKGKLRGVESYGMICAEDEIGLGNDHAGIMVLPDDIPAGTEAAAYFNVESDFRLEVELTPNRVDAASHYGCARDLKAYQWAQILEKGDGANVGMPVISLPDVSSFSIDRTDGAVKVQVEDSKLCPRYCGVTIRGVKVNESPEWLKNLLVAAGQRPINSIVDITNFVLLGIGQPLHCFDLAKVAGEKIVVRTCPTGTKFTTLDEVEHTLDEKDLMICDAEKPMCIAGVFGGLDSGVTEATTDVFIESAYFNPTSIRRSARRHGLSTDASFRYERGTDPNICDYAAKLAAVLIREIAGGEICGGVVDIYPDPVLPVEMNFSLKYCCGLIGKQIPRHIIIGILRALEFEVKETSDDDVLSIKVPTYRVDVTRPCDVVEEILRIYGYNNVEFGTEMHANLSKRTAVDEAYTLQQVISNDLSGQGFREIMNNSLSAVKYYDGNNDFPLENAVKVMNPLSNDLGVMRQTLLYGGLESIAHNVNRKSTDLKFYEFGNVYTFDPAKEKTEDKPLAQYSEHMELAIWMTGDIQGSSWNRKAVETTVFDLKATVFNILTKTGVALSGLKITQSTDETFSAKLEITHRSGKALAVLGILSRKALKSLDIDQEVCYASINWDYLCKLSAKFQTAYSPLEKTQPVRRDLALLLDSATPFDAVETCARKAGGKLLRDIRLFDVYEGKNLPEGKKSYAVSFTIQDPENTLKDKQIDSVMDKIIKSLQQQLGASLR